jgi:hypothetical protein
MYELNALLNYNVATEIQHCNMDPDHNRKVIVALRLGSL